MAIGVKKSSNKDGTISWIVRWVDREVGRRAWRSRSFRDENAARDFAATLDQAKRRGRYVAPTGMTVREAVAEYLARGDWAEGTKQTYAERARHVTDGLGTVPVERLSVPQVQRWVDRMSRAGLGASTVRQNVVVLSGALQSAARLGLVERDVTADVQLPTIRRRAVETWTAAQARAVLACVRAEPKWHAVYQLMLSVGLRPGELAALMWADVDWQRARLRVHRTVHRGPDGGGVREGTKRGTGRTVPLALPVLRALEVWQAESKGPWLFGGAAPLPRTTWRVKHLAVCEKAAVPPIRLHALRHTCATLNLERGLPAKLVSELLGHRSIQITLDLYSHVSDTLLADAAAGLADWLNQDQEPTDQGIAPARRSDVG